MGKAARPAGGQPLVPFREAPLVSLSVHILIGNDANNLSRALLSVSDIADEVIVISTAANDHVKSIASEFGASVLEIPWTDDFASARNHGIDHAQADWILWLDADEWIDDTTRRELPLCTEHPNVLAWLVTIVDRSGINGTSRFSPTLLPRLFRRIPELRLAGRVHEHFSPDLWETGHRMGLEVRSSSITIFHDGYSPEREADKLRRNARLMERELLDRPDQIFYEIRLSQALLKLSDSRAHCFLQRAWDKVRPITGQVEPPPKPLIAELIDSLIVRQTRGEFDTGWRLDELHTLAARWFPLWPPLIWRRANWMFKQGRFEQASQCLEHLLRLAHEGTYTKTPSFDQSILGAESCLNLAICYTALNRLQDARRYFLIAAGDPNWAEQANKNLALIAKVGSRTDVQKTELSE